MSAKETQRKSHLDLKPTPIATQNDSPVDDRPKQDPEFALAGSFERINPDPRPISEIAESELLRGFGG